MKNSGKGWNYNYFTMRLKGLGCLEESEKYK